MKLAVALALLLAALSACSADGDPVATSTAALNAETLIARRATWWHWYDGVDRGTDWRQFGWRPEPSVTSSTAPLGYGEDYVNAIPYGPDPAHKPITTYYRKDFYVADPQAIDRLRLEMMYDDGFVFYVNGREGGRANLPDGPIAVGTLASSHEANATYFGFDATGSIADLHTGWNTLAIELHQESPASTDLVFDASLVAFPRGSFDHAINHGAGWSYSDVATPGWNQPGFDDLAWPHAHGPLGYGPGEPVNPIPSGPDPAHKPRTVFFRHTFFVADPSRFDTVYADVLFDDGFIAYLNGEEVQRDWIYRGDVDARTLAYDHESRHTYVPYNFWSAISYLHPGENTLAVEVHQTSDSSSDLVFDLALRLSLKPSVL